MLTGAALMACSGRTPSQAVVPESTAVTSSSAAPPAAAPEAPAAQGPDVDAGAPVSLASASTAADVRRARIAPYGEHPSATVDARIDQLGGSVTARFTADAEQAAGHPLPHGDSLGCRVVLQTSALVDFECSTDWEPGERDDYATGFVRDYAFEIVGEDVRPTTVEAAFVDRASLDATTAHALEQTCGDLRTRDGDWYASMLPCPAGWTLADVAIGRRSLGVSWVVDHGDLAGAPYTGHVPYAAILDRLRADGPVARLLGLGAFATPAPAPAPGPEPPVGPWVIGAALHDVDAVARWTALDPNVRGDVQAYVTALPGVMQLGVAAESGLARARVVAAALGGTLAAPPEGASARIFELVRTTTSLNLRAEPNSHSSYRDTLPRNAIAVSIVDPAESAPPWATIVGSPAMGEGRASARYLEPADCDPDASAIVSAVPRARRRGEPGAEDVHRIVTGIVEHDHTSAAVLVVVRGDDSTRIVLRRLVPETCSVGDELAAWTLDHFFYDVFVTRTAEHGGETLVLANMSLPYSGAESGDPHGHDRLVALRIGARAPVWTSETTVHSPDQASDVQAPALRGPSGRGFWPLAITRRGEPIEPYRWDGTTLVRDAP
jgi:hypothetical protein